METSNKNYIRVIPLSVLIVLFVSLPAIAAEPDLVVHLPREITVNSDIVLLSDIAILKGDSGVVSGASGLGIGRLVNAGESITVDRNTVLSRLAANDISKDTVEFTGADEVVVRLKNTTIPGMQIMNFAQKFIEEKVLNESVFRVDPRTEPDDLVISNTEYVPTLEAKLLPSGSRSYAKVRVYIYGGGKEIARKDVVFDLMYSRRVALAKTEIRAGDLLSSENVKVSTIISNTPEEVGWEVPYGFSARNNFDAGDEIQMKMVEELASSMLIERNQTVIITVDQPGMHITARGKAMEKGRKGDYIKVRNIDSQRIVVVKVKEDGTVEPVL